VAVFFFTKVLKLFSSFRVVQIKIKKTNDIWINRPLPLFETIKEKEYTRQKELEKVRRKKRKAVELEESREEMEKELEGSNKKVSLIFIYIQWN
jgi:hypothetical protein